MLNTPILSPVRAFDANFRYDFKFTYSTALGGQSVKHHLIITFNDSGKVAFEQTLNDYQLFHSIPAGRLTNGKTYSAKLCVFNVDDESSDYSIPIVFKCLKTPEFKFTNIPSDGIKSSVYEFTLSYKQDNGDPLNSFSVTLYDGNGQIVHTSPVIYSVDKLSYKIDGLNNDYKYTIQAIGETISGMTAMTNREQFSVQYIQPDRFSIVKLTNEAMDGTITIESNIILIEGRYDGKPVYIDGKKIDLRDGKPAIFYDGFKIGADFSLQLVAEDFNLGKPILELDGGNVTLTIYQGNKYSAYRNLYYAQLKAYNNRFVYTLDSNYFSDTQIQINMRRINHLFMLDVVEVK